MKKIYILFLTCTSLFSISCSSFLEEDPRDGLLGDNAYSTLPALYRNCVASLYNCVGSYKDSEGLQGTGRGIYDLNTFTTDEAIMPLYSESPDDILLVLIFLAVLNILL